MGELIKRQDAINAVMQNYCYESDRMTALQELPVITDEKIRNEAIINYSVAVLAEVAERAKQEDAPIYEGDKEVDQWVRLSDVEKAIASSFNYGKLEKAVKERVEQVLVPFIENYDMSAYIVKLDTVLTEIVNKSNLVDNKQMLENFRCLMKEPQITEIKLTDLFKEYKKFVARNMDTSGRKVEWEESPEYEAMTVYFEFEEDLERSWSSFKYATIDFTVDEEEQQDELNRTIRLSKWNEDKKNGWEVRVDTTPNLYSLRNMEEFDLLLIKLQRADVRLVADELGDEDYVYSDTKPEPTYE